MAVLSFIEKQIICRLFGIKDGYIFSFWQGKDYNKSTTRGLLLEACGIDIFSDEGYQDLSQQKCIEKIWAECSPKTISKLLEGLCDYFEFRMGNDPEYWSNEDFQDLEAVKEIIVRLNAVDDIELPEPEQIDFSLIIRDVGANFRAGTPELAVDRLHTFATSFFRHLCETHGISTTDDHGNYYALDGNVARLKNWYKSNDYFESEFCAVALENTVNIFAKYNDIRNRKSAAHPNALLSRAEAEYAVKIIADTLMFVDKIEKTKEPTPDNDLPWDTYMEGFDQTEENSLPF